MPPFFPRGLVFEQDRVFPDLASLTIRIYVPPRAYACLFVPGTVQLVGKNQIREEDSPRSRLRDIQALDRDPCLSHPTSPLDRVYFPFAPGELSVCETQEYCLSINLH